TYNSRNTIKLIFNIRIFLVQEIGRKTRYHPKDYGDRNNILITDPSGQTRKYDVTYNGLNLDNKYCGDEFALLQVNFTLAKKSRHAKDGLHSYTVKEKTGDEIFQVRIFKKRAAYFEQFVKTFLGNIHIKAHVVFQHLAKAALLFMFFENILIVKQYKILGQLVFHHPKLWQVAEG